MNSTGKEPPHSTSSDPTTGAASRPIAAFFDLDKTIIATSSAYVYGKEFINNGMLSHLAALQLSLAKTTYMWSGHTSEQMDSSRDQLTSVVAGWSEDEVMRVTTQALHDVVSPLIYSEARELIDFHLNAGHDVVIVSASATHLVRPIAEELGIRTVIATELEVVDGHFTGEILFYAKGQVKADAIAALTEQRGYDLAASYAYSDSATDIPMLELVGHPVAVNPDRALRKHAVDAQWEVRTFKDPVPLFTPPTKIEVGIGAGVLVVIAGLTAGGIWLVQRAKDKN